MLQFSNQLPDILDAELVLAWLKRIESGQELPVAGFNWLGLAELAAFEAH